MKKILLVISISLFINSAIAQTFFFTEFPVYAGNPSANPRNLHVLDSTKLVFTAQDSAHGIELRVTDGTPANTKLIKDIYPGKYSSGLSHFLQINKKLFFVAIDTTYGREVWTTDGTTSGTQLLKDINTGTKNADPNSLFEYNGKVLFGANDSTHGIELWISDGTTAGTQLLKDIYPGTNNSAPANFVSLNGKVYFQANSGNGHDVWVTDGTPAGTKPVNGILTGNSLHFYTSALGKIFMLQYTPAHYYEIWVTDGTPTGTQLLKELAPGPNKGISGIYTTPYKGKLLIIATTTLASGAQAYLLITDGTPSGTQVLYTFPYKPSSSSSKISNFCELDNKMFFACTDGNGTKTNLWVTDGTTAGTKQVKVHNINFQTTLVEAFSLTKYNNYLYLSSTIVNNGRHIIRTDGTDSGSTLIMHPTGSKNNPVYAGDMVVFDSSLYFSSKYFSGYELWALKDTSTRPKPPTPNHINTIQEEEALHLYPNPTTGMFYITLSGSSTDVTLTNIEGKTISQYKGITNKQLRMNLTGQPQGVYILQVTNANGSSYRRILLE